MQEPPIFSHYMSVLTGYLKKQIISKQLEKAPWKTSIFVILLARGFFPLTKTHFKSYCIILQKKRSI